MLASCLAALAMATLHENDIPAKQNSFVGALFDIGDQVSISNPSVLPNDANPNLVLV